MKIKTIILFTNRMLLIQSSKIIVVIIITKMEVSNGDDYINKRN